MSEYGSSTREAMKRSMEQPAGQYRPLNRRQRASDRTVWILWLAVGLLLLSMTVGAVRNHWHLRKLTHEVSK